MGKSTRGPQWHAWRWWPAVQRGIGAAISKALKQAGCNVATKYGGNDEAAAKFKQETGIPVFRWDVSSYDACIEGLMKIESEVGPVDILVNNAGITRDTMFPA